MINFEATPTTLLEHIVIVRLHQVENGIWLVRWPMQSTRHFTE